MKIKLAILDKDTAYLQRIVSVFNNKYADKLEIYSFTDQEMALETVQKAKIHVLLAGEGYPIKPEELPQRCAFAWFVETPDIEHIDQCAAICKFQKISRIYQQILNLYSEVAADIVTTGNGENNRTKVISVLSPAGGVGCSTIASACAKALCRNGKRVFYLNLEKYGSTNMLFQGDGTETLSDALYAIKSGKANLSMKLEGIVRQDRSGVYFLTECNVVLDRLEMKREELDVLLQQIKLGEGYDNIILDMDFSFDALEMEAMRQSHNILVVSDGSENANTKIQRVFEAINILEQRGGSELTNKILLLYNKFYAQTGKQLENSYFPVLGMIPDFKGMKLQQIIEEIAKTNVFESLM